MGQKVTISHEVPEKHADTELSLYQGLYFPLEKHIFINPELNEENQLRTLYHEMGHALMYRASIPCMEKFDIDLHELIVDVYSTFIYEFFHSGESEQMDSGQSHE